MEPHTRRFVNDLPYSIRDRIQRYIDFVDEILVDIALEEGVYEQIGVVRRDIETIFLLRLLYGYYVLGQQNYERMMDFLGSFQINGFQIGGSTFQRNGTTDREWREVATELERIIDASGVQHYILASQSIETVIRDYVTNRVEGSNNGEQP